MSEIISPDEPVQKPKVISLYTRAEFTPENEPSAHVPDASLIEALEDLLGRALSGELTGMAAICIKRPTIDKEPGFSRVIVPAVLENIPRSFAEAALTGGVAMLLDDMKDTAFWTNGYDPMVCSEDTVQMESARYIPGEDDPEDGA